MSDEIRSDSLRIRKTLARTEELMGMYFRKRTIVKKLQEEFGLGPRSAWRYIRAIRRQWANAEVPPERRAELRSKLEELYQRAVERDDIKGAAMTVRQLAELDGLDQPQQHEHHHFAPLRADVKEVQDASRRLAERNVTVINGGKSDSTDQ